MCSGIRSARAFYVACHAKPKRPGKTCQGLQDALSKLPSRSCERWETGCGGKSSRIWPNSPTGSLVVADAAYRGYDLAHESLAAGASFLVRVSSKVWLYVDEATPLKDFQEGVVYYWPQERQQAGQPPLKLRLIRVRNRRRKHAVWLLTDVLESSRLDVHHAAQFYRWRWTI